MAKNKDADKFLKRLVSAVDLDMDVGRKLSMQVGVILESYDDVDIVMTKEFIKRLEEAIDEAKRAM